MAARRRLTVKARRPHGPRKSVPNVPDDFYEDDTLSRMVKLLLNAESDKKQIRTRDSTS